MSKIPKSFIEDLLQRVNIVDVISSCVELKKKGKNYQSCCPLPGHNEKTPSFTVSEEKQFFHCFGCGEHGNAIDFIMEYKGVPFVEAVKEIAGFVGMEIPTPKSVKKIDEQFIAKKKVLKSIYDLGQKNTITQKHSALLQELGISDEQAKECKIGFIGKNDLLSALFTDEKQIRAALELGFVRTDHKNTFDEDLLIISTQIKDNLLGLTLFNDRDIQLHIGLSAKANEPLLQGPMNQYSCKEALVFTHVIDFIKHQGPENKFAVTSYENQLTDNQVKGISRYHDIMHYQIRDGEINQKAFEILPYITANLNLTIGQQKQDVIDWVIEIIEDKIGYQANATPTNLNKELTFFTEKVEDALWKAAITHEVAKTHGLSANEILNPGRLTDENKGLTQNQSTSIPSPIIF